MSSSSSWNSEPTSQILLPGLPNDIASLILLFIPYSHHSRLKLISKAWKQFFSSKTLIPLRQSLLSPHHLSHLLCLFPQDPSISCPYLFDPKTLAWCPLPPMPCNPHVYGLCNFTSLAIGPHLYVLGGSVFDTRSFPLDRPCSTSSAYRFDFFDSAWTRLSPMISPRGSFACAANSGRIVVAGGGSRHAMFGAAGSRMSSVEMYEVEKDKWVALDGLPRFRAGCVGFLVGNGEEREFWVMGGYGESRTVDGVFPVDEYYRDVVVMGLKNGGGKWREIGDMWEEGERRRLGKTVVVDDDDDNGNGGIPIIFMLDGSNIFRYNMSSNRWQKDSDVPRKAPDDSSFGFVALDGELYVMTLLGGADSAEAQRSRLQKRRPTLLIQIYHPGRRAWRSQVTKLPFHYTLDFRTAGMCTIRL